MNHRRHIRFINKKFQWRMILRVYLFLFLTVLLVSGLTYLGTDNRLNPTVHDSLRAAQSTREILDDLILACALSSLVVGMIFVTLTFRIVTHRIAGPIFHLHRVIDAVSQGDLTQDAHTRARDEFKELAEAVERLITHEKNQIEALRGEAALLEATGSLEGEARETLNRIKGILEKYKTV